MSSKEKLLKGIRKKGLPTEITALRMMESKGFTVVAQLPFVDQDEGELRSIDFLAGKYKTKETQNGKSISNSAVRMKLYVECKKNEKNPIIFFKSGSSFDIKLKQILMNPESKSVFAFTSYLLNDFTDSFRILEIKRIANFYDIIGNCKDFFLEAQMQLLKSIKYHEKFIESDKMMIIPVFVFNGKMYEYKYSNEKEDLIEIPYVTYLSNGLPFDPTPTLIDVVTLEEFPNYLDRVLEQFEQYPKPKIDLKSLRSI